MKFRFLFIFFIVFPWSVFTQRDCTVKTSEKIEVGLAFSIEFEILHQKGAAIDFVADKNEVQSHIDTTVPKPFDIELIRFEDTLKPGALLDTTVFSLTFMPWDTGYVKFIDYSYRFAEEIVPLPEVSLEIKIALLDSSGTIKDIREYFPEIPSENKEDAMKSETPWWVYVLSSFLGLGIMTSLLYWMIKKKRKKAEKILNPFESALDKLDQLYESRVWENDVKSFYSSLSLILRIYISEDLSLNLMDKTTTQCGGLLKRKMNDPQLVKQILSHLNISDMVKFAGSKPDYATIESSIMEVKNILIQINQFKTENE